MCMWRESVLLRIGGVPRGEQAGLSSLQEGDGGTQEVQRQQEPGTTSLGNDGRVASDTCDLLLLKGPRL